MKHVLKKIVFGLSSPLIPEKTSPYAARNVDGIPLTKINHKFLKNIFSV